MSAPRPRPPAPAPAPPSLRAVAKRVEARLAVLLDAEEDRWATVDPDLLAPLRSLRRLLESGGKRLRPAFCHWAFVGVGGDPGDPRVVDAGAALEMLHAFALVHDDVIDGSATRRGEDTAHVEYATRHARAGWRGEGRRFGEGVAILVGDLAHVYAGHLLGRVPPTTAAVWDELRVEVNMGQYLDLLGTVRADRDRALAHRVARYKSGKYTIERPLHVGATLAGAGDRAVAALSAYGDPLGEAFQLRDDVLGAFGDPALTGKPVGEDLREGKPTPLLAAAVKRVADGQGAVLDRVGAADLTDDEVARIQDVLVETGALAEVERLIDGLAGRAIDALAEGHLTGEARRELTELAHFVATRDR